MLFPHLTKCCIDPATGQTWKNLTQEDKRYTRRRSSSTCFYNSVRSWCSLTGWFLCPLLERLWMLPYPHSDKKNLSLLIFEYHIILTISHISVSPHSFILEVFDVFNIKGLDILAVKWDLPCTRSGQVCYRDKECKMLKQRSGKSLSKSHDT